MEEQKERIRKLKEETQKVGAELMRKIDQVTGDPRTLRVSPEISKIWNELCRLHVDAMVLCYQAMDNKELIEDCGEISQPRTCVERVNKLFKMML